MRGKCSSSVNRVALHQGPDRGTAQPEDEIAFRKTVGGPEGSGVAEVALRSGRLLGMSARLSGAPRLLIRKSS